MLPITPLTLLVVGASSAVLWFAIGAEWERADTPG
jgi:hypothetical protein